MQCYLVMLIANMINLLMPRDAYLRKRCVYRYQRILPDPLKVYTNLKLLMFIASVYVAESTFPHTSTTNIIALDYSSYPEVKKITSKRHADLNSSSFIRKGNIKININKNNLYLVPTDERALRNLECLVGRHFWVRVRVSNEHY